MKKLADEDGTSAYQIGINCVPEESLGSGSAHNNLQPYIVMNYIIKAG